jgi:hypothetical protein
VPLGVVEVGRSGCAACRVATNAGDPRTLGVNTSLLAYANAARPQVAADWQLHFQIHFLFPK